MIRKKLFPVAFPLFFLLFSSILAAQQSGWEFLPQGNHFAPLRANYQEARVGVLYYPATANLKVDIGNSIDVIGYRLSPEEKVTAGVEFMAYAYSTSYKEYRLQIDAVDGFFGGNVTYSMAASGIPERGIRFRYIHNSAHLVDGHFDLSTEKWMGGKLPFPYTRDFAEVLLFTARHTAGWNYRAYGGGSYSVRKRPNELKRTGFSAGTELGYRVPALDVYGKPTEITGAYHFALNGVPRYSGSSHLLLGLRTGTYNGRGICVYASYYSGNNMFNEYYYEKINRFGIGFTVDF